MQSIVIFFLIKDFIQYIDQIIIDEEYPGHSGRIKTHVLNLLRKHNIEVDPRIIQVMKSNSRTPAMTLANQIMKTKKLPDAKLRISDLNQIIYTLTTR
jgi:hypothetical protein